MVKAVDKLLSDNRRSAVTGIAHARLLAVAIELRTDLTDADRRALLDQWEKVTFRIFGMCRKDARTRVGDYVRLARQLIKERPKKSATLEDLRDLGGDEFDIDEAVAALRNTNCYEGWEEELRYFMFRHEEYLAKQSGQTFDNAQWTRIWLASPGQSIEHILPQSYGSPRSTRSKKEVFVHRLGNLTLLPPKLNSSLSDTEPSKKGAAYEKTGLLVAAQLKPKLKNWGRPAVEAREDELLEWARGEWGD